MRNGYRRLFRGGKEKLTTSDKFPSLLPETCQTELYCNSLESPPTRSNVRKGSLLFSGIRGSLCIQFNCTTPVKDILANGWCSVVLVQPELG